MIDPVRRQQRHADRRLKDQLRQARNRARMRAVRAADAVAASAPDSSDYPPHIIDALFERARLQKRPWLRAQTVRVA